MLADRKAKNKQNPPYRESKLTRILQDSLTYESKTLMIVNVCSGLENVSQTKESLNFASQAMLAYWIIINSLPLKVSLFLFMN